MLPLLASQIYIQIPIIAHSYGGITKFEETMGQSAAPRLRGTYHPSRSKVYMIADEILRRIWGRGLLRSYNITTSAVA